MPKLNNQICTHDQDFIRGFNFCLSLLIICYTLLFIVYWRSTTFLKAFLFFQNIRLPKFALACCFIGLTLFSNAFSKNQFRSGAWLIGVFCLCKGYWALCTFSIMNNFWLASHKDKQCENEDKFRLYCLKRSKRPWMIQRNRYHGYDINTKIIVGLWNPFFLMNETIIHQRDMNKIKWKIATMNDQ